MNTGNVTKPDFQSNEQAFVHVWQAACLFCGNRGYHSSAINPEQWNCGESFLSADGYPFRD